MDKLLSLLRVAYPDITFQAGQQCSWSPANNTIIYPTSSISQPEAQWSLLHELGHALLGHTTYNSDIQLLKLESEAWERAKELGTQYALVIDEDHIQDCLDTYRDWLHQRSTCPTCQTVSLQQDSRTYRCHNCGESWTVSTARFCRPYRRKTDQSKTSPSKTKVTFR